MLLTVVLLTPAPATFGQGGGEDFLRRALDVEKRLLQEDLAEYRQAREAETVARRQLDEVMGQISSIVEGPLAASPAAANNLQRFEQRLVETRGAVEDASQRARHALVRLEARLQRAGLLAAMLAGGDLPAVEDVLTGRWDVELGPGGVDGVFQLDQDGTLVTGSYRMDNGRRGSLRGVFIDGNLRLEQVDVEGGFDALFDARVDVQAGRMVGFWRPMDLADGGPGGGEWAAVKTSGGGS